MKNLTIWQRLNLAVGLLIFLLLLGGTFALWMERSNTAAERHSESLNHARDRVAYELDQLTAPSRRALLEPQADSERRRSADPEGGSPESAFAASVERLQTEFARHPQLVAALRAIAQFARTELAAFNREVLTRAATDVSAAASYYAANYPDKAAKQDKLLKELSGQVQTATQTESEAARLRSLIALIGIIVASCFALVVVRFQSRSVTAPMQAIVEALAPMQRGDFTQRIRLERRDEFGVVASGLNKLADELSVLVGQVQRSGIQVNSTATEISATAREQQSTANEIAATTAEIGATSKEISATSKELVKTMNEVSHVSEETAELASSGQNAIGKMESTMRQIMEASSSITSKLAVLNEKTANINTVVTTITKVADQTNLLSLNAAIEAEKAGEYGLGFAVVAMEIRRLADQTAVATYDIEKMVKEMQSAVAAGVMGMDKFSEEVRRGVEEVRQVGTQLAQIIHQVQTLSPRFHTVNEGMHAQATGAQQISETLTQLNEAAQLTAESLRQSNVAIEQLNEAAKGLQAAVARFKLKAN
jgi:methyl-accepting chemotaxis protein WspA